MLNDAKTECERARPTDITDQELVPILALIRLYGGSVISMSQKEMLLRQDYCTGMSGLADIFIKVVDIYADEKVDIFQLSTASFDHSATKMLQIFMSK